MTGVRLPRRRIRKCIWDQFQHRAQSSRGQQVFSRVPVNRFISRKLSPHSSDRILLARGPNRGKGVLFVYRHLSSGAVLPFKDLSACSRPIWSSLIISLHIPHQHANEYFNMTLNSRYRMVQVQLICRHTTGPWLSPDIHQVAAISHPASISAPCHHPPARL